jgi:putative transcriptional regulator
MPRFHVQEDLLIDYASGALPAPISLLVASHLTFCRRCRDEVGEFEAIGGMMLEDLNPIAMAADALEQALDGLNDADAVADQAATSTSIAKRGESTGLPAPLLNAFGGEMGGISWARRAKGIEEATLATDDVRYSASLMRIQPGVSIPNHTHEGEELTLVLGGGFSDGGAHYGAGDVCRADAEISHAPVADPGEACLCLVVADGPVRLTGLVGRMLNPFLKL